MQTQDHYNNVLLPKQKSGSPVSWRDVAVRIDNEPEKVIDFMCENDYQQVWSLLHSSDTPQTIGKGMSFKPNFNQAKGSLMLLLAKQDHATLNSIIKGFRINMNTKNITTNPSLLRELENIQAIKMMPDGAYGLLIEE